MCNHGEDEKTLGLLRRYRANDREAFGEVYDLHAERVESIVSKTLRAKRDDPRVEDVCQNVWLSVVKAVQRDEEIGCFRAWLHTIARNACGEEIRGQRFRRKLQRALEARALEAPAFVPGPSYEDLDCSGFHHDLKQAVAQLPDDQREVYELHQFEDRTLDEIAARQNAPRGTVKKRLELAFAKLRVLLRRYGPEPLGGSVKGEGA
jgi:RNA polymerase sigma-70 factor (ECF subfamily)